MKQTVILYEPVTNKVSWPKAVLYSSIWLSLSLIFFSLVMGIIYYA